MQKQNSTKQQKKWLIKNFQNFDYDCGLWSVFGLLLGEWNVEREPWFQLPLFGLQVTRPFPANGKKDKEKTA